jgi:type IV pilus assembly protein PilV
MKKAACEKGFTLMEGLVSTTVLSIGVLGMAAMQGLSFTKNVDARDLSIVTNIASDMMERIQNSRRIAWAYNNLQTVGPGNCLAAGIPAPPPAAPFPSTLLSVPATRKVQGDCVQWRALMLASNLLNVQGAVQVAPVVPISANSAAVSVTVRIQWNERAQGQRLRTVAFQTQIVPE